MNELGKIIRSSRGFVPRRIFAEWLDITPSILARLERGGNVSQRTLKKVALYYGLSIKEVLDAYHKQV